VAQLLYYSGQDVGITAAPVDDSGEPISGGSVTVSVTVTDPSGAVTTPTVTQTVSGAYGAVVEAVSEGIWLYRFDASGTNGNSNAVSWVSESQFQVRPAGLEQLIDLPSVKSYLRIPVTDTSNDDALQGFILASAEIARDYCGPFVPEQHTQYFDGGHTTITPDWLPLISIQSCTEYYGLSTFVITEQPLGFQMNAFNFTADYTTGEITRRTFGGEAAYWARGVKNVKLVYTTGRQTDVPFSVRLGTLEIVRHLFQLTQLSGRTRFGGSALDGTDSPPVPSGFAVPQRVLELWAPHRRAPGFA
jgi:hypothetical protein